MREAGNPKLPALWTGAPEGDGSELSGVQWVVGAKAFLVTAQESDEVSDIGHVLFVPGRSAAPLPDAGLGGPAG